MKLAIMQPYFLPYIGYFQLIKSADTFVFYDDVTFIKQGWINRNRILLNKGEHLFSLEVIGASSYRNINNVSVGRNRLKLLKTFFQAYQKAPYFDSIKHILDSILNSEAESLSEYIIWANQLIADFLEIKTSFISSSDIKKNNELKGQDKIVEICKILNAEVYINMIGGMNLYSKEYFNKAGINLLFLTPEFKVYNQFTSEFIPGLSIIDVIMYNGKEKTIAMLDNFILK